MHSSRQSKRFILIGSATSTFGIWIDYLVILTLAAYVYQVSPYQLFVLGAAGLLPGVLASSAIGKLCDRRNPRTILQWSLLLRVVATLGLIFAQDYAMFLALVVFRSFFTATTPIATNVLVVRCASSAERTAFFASISMLGSIAKICAPMAGAVSSSIASETVSLALSALLTSISLVLFSFAKTPHARGDTDIATNTKSTEKPSIAPLLCIVSTGFFMGAMVSNHLPLMLQREGFDKGLLGVFMACAGIGNVLGGAWFSRRSSRIPAQYGSLFWPGFLQALGFGLSGLAFLLPLHYGAATLGTLFVLVGLCSASFSIALSVFIAKRYENQMGAASGLVQTCQNSMILLAPLVGAFVLQNQGAAATYFTSASIGLLAYALCLLYLRATNQLGKTS